MLIEKTASVDGADGEYLLKLGDVDINEVEKFAEDPNIVSTVIVGIVIETESYIAQYDPMHINKEQKYPTIVRFAGSMFVYL